MSKKLSDERYVKASEEAIPGFLKNIYGIGRAEEILRSDSLSESQLEKAFRNTIIEQIFNHRRMTNLDSGDISYELRRIERHDDHTIMRDTITESDSHRKDLPYSVSFFLPMQDPKDVEKFLQETVLMGIPDTVETLLTTPHSRKFIQRGRIISENSYCLDTPALGLFVDDFENSAFFGRHSCLAFRTPEAFVERANGMIDLYNRLLKTKK